MANPSKDAEGSNGDASSQAKPPTVQKLPFWKRAWAKLGFNPLVIMFMIKGSLAPTICMAIYQRPSVAANYLNFGYLMIVVSILTVPMLPRGKFLMNLFVSLLLTCFGIAMVLFGHWCANKARQHTTPAGAPPSVALGYNSSASAVNAIFMAFNIFGINAVRFASPTLMIPSVIYTILIVVGFSYGPQEATNNMSLRFSRELFYSFLTGQAISAGVSLFIIPVSSRKVFFAETAGFLQTARGLLKTQLAFVEALQCSQLSEPSVLNFNKDEGDDSQPAPEIDVSQETGNQLVYAQKKAALHAASAGLLTLGSKLQEDVVFARRETAYGYLRSADIHELHLLLRNIMLPMSGLSTITDISERLRSRRSSDWRKFEEALSPEAKNIEIPNEDQVKEQAEWQELLQAVHRSFEPVIQVLDEGVLHVLILLKLIPSPKTKAHQATDDAIPSRPPLSDDVEKGIPPPSPGDLVFGDYLEREIDTFRKQRSDSLENWAKERGLSSVFHTSTRHVRFPSEGFHEGYKTLRSIRETRASQRLHLILYMEYLLYSVAKATLALVRFAEQKVADGTMKKQRFVLPAAKTIRKWIQGILTGRDTSSGLDSMMGNAETVYLGDSLKTPKDPEHLPPKNFGQVCGDRLRLVPRVLGSGAVHFGARVAIASMSIGIMAYLKNAHAFYIRQRIVWGLVMIAIGMNPTSGSAVFTLLGNLTATIVAVVFSFINWYIVDQKTAGIIVFFFLIQMIYFYFAAKYPRFLIAIAAGAITHVLIVGYELQVRVIGEKVATATGQAFYPIYELAPYRLLTVAGGVLIAFIWTIFPVPITSSSVLRRDLGASLFLLANHVSVVTASVEQRVRGEGAAHGKRLEKARNNVLRKQLALLAAMRMNLGYMAWEPSFGGAFPEAAYRALVGEVQNIANYLTIIAFASNAFVSAQTTPPPADWISRLAASRASSPSTSVQSHQVTTLLSLLSAAILNKQPLPPYLQGPQRSQVSEHLGRADGTGVLDLSNINEPGFRALAVMEVANVCVLDSVGEVVRLVRGLVGEVDFSYEVRTAGEGENAEGKMKVG